MVQAFGYGVLGIHLVKRGACRIVLYHQLDHYAAPPAIGRRVTEGRLVPAILRGFKCNVPGKEERPRPEPPVMGLDRGFEVIDLVSKLPDGKRRQLTARSRPTQ